MPLCQKHRKHIGLIKAGLNSGVVVFSSGRNSEILPYNILVRLYESSGSAIAPTHRIMCFILFMLLCKYPPVLNNAYTINSIILF